MESLDTALLKEEMPGDVAMARAMKRKEKAIKRNRDNTQTKKPISFDSKGTIDASITFGNIISFFSSSNGESIKNLGFVRRHAQKECKIFVECGNVRLPEQPITGYVTLSYTGPLSYYGHSTHISPTKPLDSNLKPGDLAFCIEDGIHYEGRVRRINSERVRLKHVVAEGRYIGNKTIPIKKP